MPGWSLASIEMGIPKVIRFSILLGFYASPCPRPRPTHPQTHTTPSLLPCLLGVEGGGFLAAGLWVPPPLAGPDPSLMRLRRSCQLCCFYKVSLERDELECWPGKRVPPQV